MDRREFLRITGLGMGTLVVPVLGRPVPLSGAVTPVPTADRKALAAVALDAARARGACASAPSPMPSARGSSPRMVVRVVMRIGRSRRRPASATASRVVMPAPVRNCPAWSN